MDETLATSIPSLDSLQNVKGVQALQDEYYICLDRLVEQAKKDKAEWTAKADIAAAKLAKQQVADELAKQQVEQQANQQASNQSMEQNNTENTFCPSEYTPALSFKLVFSFDLTFVGPFECCLAN